MTSAVLIIQAWTVALCRAAITAAGLDQAALRVTVYPRRDVPRPYIWVPLPDEREDTELSDNTDYACEVMAALEIHMTGETGAELSLVASIAEQVINGAEAAPAPGGGWRRILLQLDEHSDLILDDENVNIYGRRIVFKNNLSRPR